MEATRQKRPEFSLGMAVQWGCRLFVAGVFLVAAWPKLLNPAGFAKNIHAYNLLPDAWVNALAIFLPWLELMAALALLLLPMLRRGALVALAGMTAVFIGAIASAMARGINIDCGCFSTTGQGMRTGWLHLLLDAALLVACIVVYVMDRSREKPGAAANQ